MSNTVCKDKCQDPDGCIYAIRYSHCDDCMNRCPMKEGAMCQECGCYEDCCDCEEFTE